MTILHGVCLCDDINVMQDKAMAWRNDLGGFANNEATCQGGADLRNHLINFMNQVVTIIIFTAPPDIMESKQNHTRSASSSSRCLNTLKET